MPGFPKSLLSPKTTPACFCISPSIPRLGFIFFFLDKGELAVCSLQKMESLNSSLEGKIWHNETNQKKKRKTKFLGGKNHFPPLHSCSSISACCDHHTPDCLYFTHLIEMNSWRELRVFSPPCSGFGEGSGGGETWMGSTGCQAWLCTAKNVSPVSPVCPVLLSPAVPYLSHTVGATWFSLC